MHNQRRTGRPPAFTLIELLIVVAIIAILAAIAIPNFLEAQTRARVARVKADMRTMATALEVYRADNTGYPPEGYPYGLPGSGAADDGILQQFDPIWDASLSLIRLTTPVAYLSSTASVTDPFLDKTQVADTTILGNRDVHSLFYVDYAHFALLRFTALDDRAQVFPAWGMASVGPDHNIDGALFAPWQMARFGDSAAAAISRRIYDPTNGSVSAGDIPRFGGEFSSNTVAFTGN